MDSVSARWAPRTGGAISLCGANPWRGVRASLRTSGPSGVGIFDVDLQDAALNNLAWVQNTLAVGPYTNRYKDADTIIFSRGDRLLAGINQRGSWVNHWVQTPWANTQIHDYTGHVEDERTDGAGRVELWIPSQGYVMMAPLR
jgi:Alpha-amylase C-terminal